MATLIRVLLSILLVTLPIAGFADTTVGHLSGCGSGAIASGSHAIHVFGSLGRSFDSRSVRAVTLAGEDEFARVNAQCAESFPGSVGFLRPGLSPNLPNPFRTETEIGFVVSTEGRVVVRIYDVSGRPVRTLVEGIKSPHERHRVVWDGKNEAGELLANGLYFCQLVTPAFSETRKIVLLR